ncbi:MAG: antibiotic biosynthesis monooxygenase [Bacteroidetes bacterium]|nr:MAG: antibiotic biosynthesis monooxygenase [Bacteroidota bacterium]
MIRRIVKMTFQKDKTDDFLKWFEEHKDKIKNFEGCLHLELWRDAEQPNIFYTFSIWDSHESIEKYRQSEIFQKVWNYTKTLFRDKPMAFSATQEIIV